MAQLQSAVQANAAIEAALQAKGYDDEDVVAVQTDASGTVWVFVDDTEDTTNG